MGQVTCDVRIVLLLSLLHGYLFLIAGSGTDGPLEDTTLDISSARFKSEFLQELQAGDAPYFDVSTPGNITGLVGHPVRLLCRVKNLQNRTVSWVRHRDIHLLTVGRYTYTSDQRFEAQHRPRSEEWALRIRSPQRRDSGKYECQISTTPPIGHAVYLHIVEPETVISSGAELFIQAGSTINLTCTVLHTPEPPTSITWKHGDQAINFDSDRGGISLVTEKGLSSTSRLLVQRARGADAGPYTCEPNNPGKAINFDSARGGISLVTEKGLRSTSRLLVQRARGADAGPYTCEPNNAPKAITKVHVLSGEHPAAMQQGSARSKSDHTASLLCCLLTLYVSRISNNLQFGT